MKMMNMRRNEWSLIIVLGLAVNALLASCGEEVSTEGVFPSRSLFKVLSDTVHIDGQATEAPLTLTADCDWSVQTNGWSGLHASPDRGEGSGTVTISTPVNDTPTERRGTLTLTTGTGIKKTLTLLQSPGNIILEVEPKELRFGISGGISEVTVVSNTTWTLTGGTDWCRANVKDGVAGTTSVTVTVDKSEEKDTRTATFSVTPTGSTSPRTITVTQLNKDVYLTLSPESMTFDATTAQQKELDIVCNDTWQASVSTDWVKIDKKKGTGEATINVSCEANKDGKERTATITVTCNGLTKMATVTQRNYDVSFKTIPEELIEFSSTAGTHTVTVVSNTSWTVSGGSDWCQLSTTEGNGNGSVTVAVSANEQTTERIAYITFLPTDMEPTTLTVRQAANNKPVILNVSPTELSFGADEESKTVTVECNDVWTNSVDKDWVTIVKGEQRTYGELTSTPVTVTCAANTTGAARTATLTVTAGSLQRTVSIIQTTANTPVVENLVVSDTIDCKATLNASYRSTLPVTEYGFVYATHAVPTLDDTKIPFYGSGSSGTMTTILTDLTLGTVYYVRAYATNASGTAYSDEKQFTAQGSQPGQGDNNTPTLSRGKYKWK